jgi:hypothetical protein
MYSLDTYKLTFEETFGDMKDKENYIKLNLIEQNTRGDQFAAAYFNNGEFFVRTFGFDTRTKTEIKDDELNINEAF